MHSRTHTVNTQLCVTRSSSYFVSLQETEHRQQLMHILQQTMQLVRTQEKEAASQVCNRMPVLSNFEYIQIPDNSKSMPRISSNRDRAKSHRANIREFAWKKASISVQKKKEPNLAQGLFFLSFFFFLYLLHYYNYEESCNVIISGTSSCFHWHLFDQVNFNF